MNREISVVLRAQSVIDDGDMMLYRALPGPVRTSIGPFVFFDHYRHEGLRGIGDSPHPHAGIELISYLLEGGVEHRDSMGFRDRLGPGDAQWIRAGSGILHAEQPLSGRHGLQVWAALPPGQTFAEPAYASWRASAIPQVGLDGGFVRILAGQVAGATGPARLATATTFAHVRLHAGATVMLDVDPNAELALYVMQGGIEGLNGAAALGLLTAGDRVALTAEAATDLALFGGAPVEGPIMFSGPFVMKSAEELTRAKRAYASGQMGRLDGVPF